jgi:hypothetical protein
MLDKNDKPCNFSDELFFGLFVKRFRTKDEFIDNINSRDTFDHTSTITEVVSNDQSVKKIRHRRVNVGSNKQTRVRQPDEYEFYLSHIRFNDFNVIDIFSVPSIYTDWRYYNLNPYNIFRSLVIPGNKRDIRDLLKNSDIQETIVHLGSISKPRGENKFTFESLNMGKLAYWAHPLEYNTEPKYVFVNGYNILVFLHAYSHTNSHRLKGMLDLYNKHIVTLMDVVYKKVGKCKFITSVGDPTERIGVTIDAQTLNDARSRGCLFIRKCEIGSNIHSYADQLYKKHPEYVYDRSL